MFHYLRTLVLLLLVSFTTALYAQPALEENVNTEQAVGALVVEPSPINSAPEVGKHVMATTDAGSMILSLLMVLALIFISALVLKRFNFTQQNSGQMKVISSLSLGVKERLVVAQVGEQQLVLGVTSQQITLIKSLEEPITVNQPENASALTGNILAFLQKSNLNNKNKPS